MTEQDISEPRSIAIPVVLSAELLTALDGWIDRHATPAPSRAEAISQLLAGVLGGHGPSTTIPRLVTGRDIV